MTFRSTAALPLLLLGAAADEVATPARTVDGRPAVLAKPFGLDGPVAKLHDRLATSPAWARSRPAPAARVALADPGTTRADGGAWPERSRKVRG